MGVLNWTKSTFLPFLVVFSSTVIYAKTNNSHRVPDPDNGSCETTKGVRFCSPGAQDSVSIGNVTTSGSEPNKIRCLSNGVPVSTCPSVKFLGYAYSTNVTGAGHLCPFYYALPTEKITNAFKGACIPSNATFIGQLFTTVSHDTSSCSVVLQGYDYAKGVAGDCDTQTTSKGPKCIHLPSCNRPTIINDSFLHKLGITMVNPHPTANIGHETNDTSTPKPKLVEKHKAELVIRRVKKPTHWLWKDHILELGVVSIVVFFLLTIGIKIYVVDKVMECYGHSRVVRFDLEKQQSFRYTKCLPSSPSQSNQSPKNVEQPRLDKLPSKPILKNTPNKTNKAVPIAKSLSPHNFKSLDSSSSSSQYFDALEGSISEEIMYSQPLMTAIERGEEA